MATLDAAAPGTHLTPVRVYYEDTDAGGIVYYANYLKFAERARTEFLRDVSGGHYARMLKDGMMFVVRRCTVDYNRPAALDDLLGVHSRVLQLGGATLAAEQIVRRGTEDLVHITVDLACLGPAGRPARIPAPLRAALLDFRATALG